MVYKRVKEIPPGSGNYYAYLVKGVRKNGKVKQEIVKYLGRENPEKETKDKKGRMPPIIQGTSEYEVERRGDWVVKKPKTRGKRFSLERDYRVFKDLGDLAPKTKYIPQKGVLEQRVVRGRFARKDEMPVIKEKIRKKGYRPHRIRRSDVIVTGDVDMRGFKVVDVGYFKKM